LLARVEFAIDATVAVVVVAAAWQGLSMGVPAAWLGNFVDAAEAQLSAIAFIVANDDAAHAGERRVHGDGEKTDCGGESHARNVTKRGSLIWQIVSSEKVERK